jgi:hypothetical protein
MSEHETLQRVISSADQPTWLRALYSKKASSPSAHWYRDNETNTHATKQTNSDSRAHASKHISTFAEVPVFAVLGSLFLSSMATQY